MLPFKHLSCHQATLYRLLRRGGLPGFRLGGDGDWRFRREYIDRWIEERHPRPGAGDVARKRGRWSAPKGDGHRDSRSRTIPRAWREEFDGLKAL
jgi:excisionase family DNA binding protein